MRVILLGTGTSHGVPMIGCDCAVCTSSDPRDKRTRVSIYVEYNGVSILVDAPPELRLQCIAHDVRHLDAVLFTHHHADHVTGLDDLRRFNWIQGTTLRCYAQPVDIEAIRRMFLYAFQDDADYPSHKPDLQFVPIDGAIELAAVPQAHEQGSEQRSGSCTVVPVPLLHGPTEVLGFRFGNFAYCTDCHTIPESSMALLQGLDVLILDGVRRKPHPTHFSLSGAVECAQQVSAKCTYFTHIAHDLGHEQTNKDLPDNMALAYDGQVIEL